MSQLSEDPSSNIGYSRRFLEPRMEVIPLAILMASLSPLSQYLNYVFVK